MQASKKRPLSQTYLTPVEWHIVFASVEMAKVCSKGPAHNFSYLKATLQYWYLYWKAYRFSRHLPFNSEYHQMLIFIGLFFSIEMLLVGLYENTFGRISYWGAKGKYLTEDVFYGKMLTRYAEFIHTVPYYEYDYAKEARDLKEQPVGQSILRAAERRIWLTIYLTVKDWVARFSKKLNSASFAPDDKSLQAVVSNLPKDNNLVTLETENELVLVELERYIAFDMKVMELSAYSDFIFREIAGNSKICVAVLKRKGKPLPEFAERLFAVSSLTDKQIERVVVQLNANNLTRFIRELPQHRLTLQKIFDY